MWSLYIYISIYIDIYRLGKYIDICRKLSSHHITLNINTLSPIIHKHIKTQASAWKRSSLPRSEVNPMLPLVSTGSSFWNFSAVGSPPSLLLHSHPQHSRRKASMHHPSQLLMTVLNSTTCSTLPTLVWHRLWSLLEMLQTLPLHNSKLWLGDSSCLARQHRGLLQITNPFSILILLLESSRMVLGILVTRPMLVYWRMHTCQRCHCRQTFFKRGEHVWSDSDWGVFLDDLNYLYFRGWWYSFMRWERGVLFEQEEQHPCRERGALYFWAFFFLK